MTPHRPDFGAQAEGAVRAEGAVHYLRKPGGAALFPQPTEQCREHLPADDAEDLVARQLLQLSGQQPKLLVGERHHRLYPLDIRKIDYIEADGNYVTIRAGSSEYISRDSIKRLSADLAAFGFVRIDRSILLNIRAVAFAEPVGRGILAFTLSSGACLHSSRTYRGAILRVLPWHHCRAGADGSSDGDARD
jgi:two-component system LytT family response regulator